MSENITKSKLSKKDIFKSYVYWMMFALSCQNMERMEAPAFAASWERWQISFTTVLKIKKR